MEDNLTNDVGFMACECREEEKTNFQNCVREHHLESSLCVEVEKRL